MASTLLAAVSLTALAICSDTSGWESGVMQRQLQPDISLEVMAELSLSVFSAADCLMVQCVDVSLCVASGQCRSFSEYYFCF